MNDLRVTVGIVAALGVAIGLGLVSLLRGNGDEEHPSPASTSSKENAASIDAELAACRDELASERSARRALAEEMEKRTDLFAKELAKRQSSRTAESKLPEIAELSLLEAAKLKSAKLGSQHITSGDPDNPFGANWLSEDALLELDMDPEEIARLRDRFEELEVEKRELHNIALRSGWLENPQYGAAIRESYQELREDVGDEDYDKILYATGQSNRIRVERVLGGSNADNSGIRPGDVIVSYAGKRIFAQGSLDRLTAEAQMAENTRVEVLRDGEIVYLVVPRGPLGAKFERLRVTPGS
jgi:hypothetical protein